MSQKYPVRQVVLRYVNRLSDYLYMCARYADYCAQNKKSGQIQDQVVRNIMKEL